MPIGRDGAVLRQIRVLFEVGTLAGLTDGQLLERFTARRDEAAELAFAALVERHGPMVLRVCRGVLRDEHDAQDAFQATFLVLVRKAGSLWVRDSLGPWLHAVASRVAAQARSAARLRRIHERSGDVTAAKTSGGHDRDDPAALIREEIDRLPERYRIPVVLCDLEGRTHEDAARHLRCPVGTVKSRLARARERLRWSLIRRGLAPSAGLMVLASWADSASAAMPAALVAITARTASRFAAGGASSTGVVPASVAAITERVLKAMYLTKLRMVGVLLLVGVLASGAAVRARQEPGARPEVGSSDRAPRGDVERELLRMEQEWTDAIVNHDRGAIDRIIADDAVLTDPAGTVRDKADYLALIVSDPSGVESREISDLRVRVFANAAVVTGRTEFKASRVAHHSGTYRWTNTYVRRQGRWRCVAAQEGRVFGQPTAATAEGSAVRPSEDGPRPVAPPSAP